MSYLDLKNHGRAMLDRTYQAGTKMLVYLMVTTLASNVHLLFRHDMHKFHVIIVDLPAQLEWYQLHTDIAVFLSLAENLSPAS